MKKRLQGLFAGVLIGAMLTGGMTFAKNGTETIQALYNNIKIYVDGVKVQTKDVNGNSVEPFVYNGTTYLPVRAVGEAIGKTVTWDGETQSVYLGKKPGDVQYLMDVCPPYDNNYFSALYTSSNGEYFLMGGKRYTNGFSLNNSNWSEGEIYFNLDSKYKNITLDMGPVDGSGFTLAEPNGPEDTTIVKFFVDDKLIKDYTLCDGDLPKTVTIPINYGMKLKVTHCSRDGSVGFGNIVVE